MTTIRSLALLAALLGPSTGPALAAGEGCDAAPCQSGPWLSLAGLWAFASGAAQWTIAVDESGRFHAEAPRSVMIGREQATYTSTLSGTISHDRVALSIKADGFSLPNFVPGPSTVCTGVPAGPGRYRGSCANGNQRMDFSFSRAAPPAP